MIPWRNPGIAVRKKDNVVRHEQLCEPNVPRLEIERIFSDLVRRCRADGGVGTPIKGFQHREDGSQIVRVEMARAK